jgi:hypothetical protein
MNQLAFNPTIPTTHPMVSFCFFFDVINDLDTASSTRTSKKRDHVQALHTLMHDYFDENSTYTDQDFRDRYRLPKSLFLNIVDAIQTRFEWFQEGFDGMMKPSFTPIQKCISAMSQLATGSPSDRFDSYLNMAA